MSTPPSHTTVVYVWELPVRIYHWINAACVVVLCATGFIIGDPPSLMSTSEASNQYWFGVVRFIHFVAAYVFLFNYLFRVYWSVVGNRYASWRHFLPVTREFWREVVQVLRIDILQVEARDLLTIGHNALAGLTYLLLFLVAVFQIVTGFGLYAAMSDAWLPQLFAWIVPLMGGDMAVRQWHHAAMWIFVLFTLVHVYLVIYHDYVEARGTTSSMVGGWKFIDSDEVVDRAKKEGPGRHYPV